MKSEPLENKRKDVIVYLDDIDNSCNYDFKNSEDGEIFMFDDIKSAVLGLKKELNEEKERLNRVYKEFGDKKDLHLSHGISFALECIDKWLKDVIEK